MKIFYSNEKLPLEFNYFGKDFRGEPIYQKVDEYVKGVFLAGPSPRDDKIKSWRIRAIELFKKYEFDGSLFIPERKNWKAKFNYEDQIEWELQGLEWCETHMFWVPRDLKIMPAFTTNVEFGMIVPNKRNVFYGRPDDAPKNTYLDFLYKRYHKKQIYDNLEKMIKGICDEMSL